MAARGRPRIADNEKAKKGTLQKCRVRKASVNAPKIESLPEPPDWLGSIGKQEFKQKIDLLDKMGMLFKTDISMVAALASEWENYVEAEMQLKNRARWYKVEDEMGQMKYAAKHPLQTVSKESLKAYIELCNEFGFSPQSRSKLSMPDKKEPSKASKLLKSAV